MPPDKALILAADRNFIGSYRKLVEHCPGGAVREFGGVFAFATGLPIGIFNGCIVASPVAAHDLANALDWIGAREVPYRLWIHEGLTGKLRPVALRRGMEEDPWLVPQMVLGPLPELPPPAPGVASRAVTNAESLIEHRAVYVEDGMSDDVVRRIFSDSFAADPDVQLFTTSLEGRPVGTSLALRTGDVSGVYAVGTLPEVRRRGVGTAATWAAVAGGRAWGCDTIVLQASEMGFPIYEAMGFDTVVRYALFRP